MAEQEQKTGAEPRNRAVWRFAKKAGATVLITAALMIPRIRRLRRNAPAWTAVRLVAVFTGGWLVWQFVRSGAGVGHLLFGIALAAFALLIRARPERRSTDELARDLGALIVLNGGAFLASNRKKPVRPVNIFAAADRLLILNSHERRLAEIPLISIVRLSARPLTGNLQSGGKGTSWEVELVTNSHAAGTVTFRYEGYFAEHLAHVAEKALNSLLKRELPVLQD